ncbi:DUF2267 domain-containing protein [Micromonospora sp. NPDC000089]|uniref:DUF2267 domain-containing protein n=1 Tax=unclassified Micromonospora TaxID=2617518 RepID=UPI0036B5A398
MRFPLFVAAVARRAELPPETAAAIARATLVTVAERVSAGEAGDLSAQLPDELSGYLAAPPPTDAPQPRLTGPHPGGGAAAFGPVEFLRRVADRAGVEPATAQAGVRAVFATLREAVTVGEFHDLVAQLPARPGGAVDPGPPRPSGGAR